MSMQLALVQTVLALWVMVRAPVYAFRISRAFGALVTIGFALAMIYCGLCRVGDRFPVYMDEVKGVPLARQRLILEKVLPVIAQTHGADFSDSGDGTVARLDCAYGMIKFSEGSDTIEMDVYGPFKPGPMRQLAADTVTALRAAGLEFRAVDVPGGEAAFGADERPVIRAQ